MYPRLRGSWSMFLHIEAILGQASVTSVTIWRKSSLEEKSLLYKQKSGYSRA